MADITLTLTTAGLDKLVDAQSAVTDPIQVTEVGLSDTAITVAPTLTALTGEFKRIASFAGTSVSETIIHMAAQDSSTDAYNVRSIALYLSDGTLFAAYSQSTPIFTKVSLASFLLAFDVAFETDVSAAITFGDATFLNPPASETVKGVAEIATQTETDAGLDDERIVTPKKLAAVLTGLVSLFGGDLSSLLERTISGSGLATGGGDLTSDRVITVPAATAEEAEAGIDDTVALTPASIVNILATLASRAAAAREIATAGLASGGGDLNANRTITVPKASRAETRAGVRDDAAITPYGLFGMLYSSGIGSTLVLHVAGVIIQHMTGTALHDGYTTITLPETFPTACVGAFVNSGNPAHAQQDNGPYASSWTASTVTIYNAIDNSTAFNLLAIGK